MTAPKSVTAHPEMDWRSIDDQAWITGNVVDPDAALSQVYIAHIDPMYDVECKESPQSIRSHVIEARDPLTISGEFRCNEGYKKWCSWGGTVQDGKWVVA